MAVHRHQAGFDFAQELIENGRFDAENSWSWSADDGNALLGPNGDDWENYGRHHLGWDDQANPETKDRWLYPFAKEGRVFRSALNAIRSRAGQNNHDTVYSAAGTLRDMIDQRTENRKAPEKPIELRSGGEVRALDDGQFEGYIAVWDTVDDYNSTFVRGAFKKTIDERGGKIKVFFDHRDVVGKPLEIREDDHGVFVRGQLSLGVEEARKAHELMKDGVIDGLSFGFRSIKERRRGGVREIREVQLMEFGPVIFPANDAAEIQDVRASRIEDSIGAPDPEKDSAESRGGDSPGEDEGDSDDPEDPEDRATDFDRTHQEIELNGRHFRLLMALEETLLDIWWGWVDGTLDQDLQTAVDNALTDFQAQYLEFVDEALAAQENRGDQANPDAPARNELARAVRGHIRSQGTTVEDLARDTSLTLSELRDLKSGRPIAATGKVAELSEEVRQAHDDQRGEAAEALLREVRAGLSPAKARRLQALLQRDNTRAGDDAPLGDGDPETEGRSIAGALREFRTQLEKDASHAE